MCLSHVKYALSSIYFMYVKVSKLEGRLVMVNKQVISTCRELIT